MTISKLLKNNNILFQSSQLRDINQIDAKITSLREMLQMKTGDQAYLQAINVTHEQLDLRKNEIEQRLFLLKHENRTYQKEFKDLQVELAGLEQELKQTVNALRENQLHIRIHQIERELYVLCGDENSLLNKVRNAYQTGVGKLEDCQELEERKKSLNEEKASLQRILSVLPASQIEQYMRGKLQMAIDGLVSQRKTVLNFIDDLQNWCEECNGSTEYQNRIKAARRIYDCYIENKTHLDLNFLGLRSLPHAIGQLTQLTVLNAHGNQLRALPSEIGLLVRLLQLGLSENQFQALPREIGQLTQLIELDVSANQLQALPSEIGQLVRLSNLYISDNQLTTLPPAISQLTGLIELDVSSNQLQSLPPAISQFTGLIELDVSSNQLQALPPGISQLKQLTKLDISSNQLQALPPEISRLTQLTKLDVSSNQLQALPPGIGELAHLTELVVRANQIQTLPHEIGELAQLTRLLVSRNQLQSLPSELARLPRGCIFNAENNRLTLAVVQTFQAQIAQQFAQNPDLGPAFQFSIFNANPVLNQNSPLENVISFWLNRADESIWKEIPKEMLSNESPIQLKRNALYQPLFTKLTSHDQENLRKFLIRLQNTSDFKDPKTRQNIILRAIQMLHGACTHEEFQQKLMAIIDVALSDCNDRVAYYFNQVELQWQLYCSSGAADPAKLARLLIGARRLDILHKIAEEKIKAKGLRDGIEVHLYFQVRLNDELKLPVSTQGMLYAGMSRISDGELVEAKNYVLAQTSSSEQFVEILTSSEHWEQRMQKEHPDQFDAINEQISDKITEVSENHSLSQQEAKNLIDKLQEEQKTQTRDLVFKLTEQFVKGTLLGSSSSSNN
jgi:Leucine-rich repeat (LRR) protein